MNFKGIIRDIEKNIKPFLHNLKNEATETKEAALIIQKYVKGEKITPEEEKMFKEQVKDSLKVVGIMIPFVLIPGSSLLLPLIVKAAAKYNINILPSSFNNK